MLGDGAETCPVDLGDIGRIKAPPGHDPQRLVSREERLIDLVVRIERGVVEDELHNFEEVVLEDVEIRLAELGKAHGVQAFLQIRCASPRAGPGQKLRLFGATVAILGQRYDLDLLHGGKVAL